MPLSSYVKRVWVANFVVDFRCCHDGLLAESYKVGRTPYEGDAMIFIGRDRRRFKVFYADGNGLWVSYKRFNRGTSKTNFSFVSDPACREISIAELSLLLDGAAYTVHKTKGRDPVVDD